MRVPGAGHRSVSLLAPQAMTRTLTHTRAPTLTHTPAGVRQRSIKLMVLEATAVDLAARRVVLHPACRAQLDEL